MNRIGFAAAAAMVAVLLGASSCPAKGGPDAGGQTVPGPSAQQPAPKADPKPKADARKPLTVRFMVSQERNRLVTIEWQYNAVKPPAKPHQEALWTWDHYAQEPGRAALTARADIIPAPFDLECTVLIVERPDIKPATDKGREFCFAELQVP